MVVRLLVWSLVCPSPASPASGDRACLPCLYVCFCSVNKLICVVFQVPHVSIAPIRLSRCDSLAWSGVSRSSVLLQTGISPCSVAEEHICTYAVPVSSHL